MRLTHCICDMTHMRLTHCICDITHMRLTHCICDMTHSRANGYPLVARRCGRPDFFHTWHHKFYMGHDSYEIGSFQM